MEAYNEKDLNKAIERAINTQNHFWWGCVIGLQYGSIYTIRVDKYEVLSYCVNTEEEKSEQFQPIVRVKYGSPYKGMSKTGHIENWFSDDHEPVNVSYLRIKPEAVIYETGATKHYINSLILFTDTTSHLCNLRNQIYEENKFDVEIFPIMFVPLCDSARHAFLSEIDEDANEYKPINKMRYKKYNADVLEFCKIYVSRFNDWKLEDEL